MDTFWKAAVASLVMGAVVVRSTLPARRFPAQAFELGVIITVVLDFICHGLLAEDKRAMRLALRHILTASFPPESYPQTGRGKNKGKEK